MDTGTRRQLVESEFAARRDSCQRAADLLGIGSLARATLADLSSLEDALLRRRARHVVTEVARVYEAANALAHDRLDSVGALMNASHASLRDDFEVSGPALDAIVSIAADAPGCVGARMTGGGFAGCAIALVDRSQAGQFEDEVLNLFRPPSAQRTELPARLYAIAPARGAELLATPT